MPPTRSRRPRTARYFAPDNVILSPHSASLSKEAAIRMAISTARNVLSSIDGKLDLSVSQWRRQTYRLDCFRKSISV
jgi:phosphoglycerate dehydrogenase-like enzyme